MNAKEIPYAEDSFTLQNPEVGDGDKIEKDEYSLLDVASLHLEKILRLSDQLDRNVTFIGMSMGGMVLSILASKFRKQLQKECRFIYMATSANTTNNPAIPDELMQSWFNAKLGCIDSFKAILSPFFSESYLSAHYERFTEYAVYRAQGGNQQTPNAFYRQLAAVKGFDGAHFFPNIDPSESCFYVGGSDRVFTSAHSEDLKALVPTAEFKVFQNVGHMFNLELPSSFSSVAQ